MTDKRPLLVLGFVILLMVGGYFLTNRSNATVQDLPTTSTTAATATSTTINGNAQTPPSAVGTATSWEEGLTRITDIENELFSNPDPRRVGEIMLPTCSCYQETVDALTALQSAGNRVAGANITLVETTFIKQVGDNRVQVFTEPKPAGFPTIDRNGNTVASPPVGTGLPFLYILDRGSDGLWRLADRNIAGATS